MLNVLNDNELKLLKEMQENCIKQSIYIDPYAMKKYNLLRHLEDITNTLNNIQKLLKESKEYKVSEAMGLDSKQSILIKIVKEIEKEVQK